MRGSSTFALAIEKYTLLEPYYIENNEIVF